MSDQRISLSDISYPVFKLGTTKPTIDNGVMFYFYERELDDKVLPILRILDDKNVPGDSLALRRIYLDNEGVALSKIGKAIFFLGDLIKLATPRVWFIDSAGKLFNYIKNNRAKLTFHKIRKILPIKTGGVIVEVAGISSRFKALYPPEAGIEYVGLLHFNKSLTLYGFYDKEYKSTWRNV